MYLLSGTLLHGKEDVVPSASMKFIPVDESVTSEKPTNGLSKVNLSGN